MAFFNFPHTRTYDTDLGWIIQEINRVKELLNQYLENAVITFADPITWDITEQYTALTMVVDSDGTAYLSKQPVPAGIDITNTNYWLPVFNYDDNINTLRSQIAYNAQNSATTGAELQPNDLVFWNGLIYRVLTNMPAGTAFIIGSNIEKYTVDKKFNSLKNSIDAEAAARESADNALQQNIDAEAEARQAADTTLQQNIDAEAEARENADIAINESITTIENKLAWYYPEKYGAKGDGVTDDTAAIQAMFNDMVLDSIAVFTAPIYLISDTINITQHDLRITGLARSEYCPVIRTTKTNGISFHITGFGFSANDIAFDGPNMANNGVVLIDLDADNTDRDGNIDAEFRNCSFSRAGTGVRGHGRNVRCFNCLFSNVFNGVNAVQTVINTDNRGYAILSNRFHSVNTVFRNEINNTTVNKNIILSDNFCDMSFTLYVGPGGGVVIKNNAFFSMGSTSESSIIVITDDTLQSLNILNVVSGNVINGRPYTGTGYAIWIQGSKAIIIGNVIQNIGGSAVGGQPGSYIIVKNNVLNNVGFNTTYSMQFSPGATGVVKNNTISNSAHSNIAVNDMTVSDNEIINAG